MQKKTIEKDGYEAVQLSFDAVPKNRVKKLVNKPDAGHFAKAGVAPARNLREFRLDDSARYEVGQTIGATFLPQATRSMSPEPPRAMASPAPSIAGTRHTGPMAHGSKYHRGVGSMSANSDPSRVFKNKHMSGHYGVERVTIQNLEVVEVDAERNLLLVRGAVPGAVKAACCLSAIPAKPEEGGNQFMPSIQVLNNAGKGRGRAESLR